MARDRQTRVKTGRTGGPRDGKADLLLCSGRRISRNGPVSLDAVAVFQDAVAASRDTAPASRDTVAASQDAVAASRDTVTAFQDAAAASRDTVGAFQDAAAASGDTVAVFQDAVAASRDAVAVSRDAAAVSLHERVRLPGERARVGHRLVSWISLLSKTHVRAIVSLFCQKPRPCACPDGAAQIDAIANITMRRVSIIGRLCDDFGGQASPMCPRSAGA